MLLSTSHLHRGMLCPVIHLYSLWPTAYGLLHSLPDTRKPHHSPRQAPESPDWLQPRPCQPHWCTCAKQAGQLRASNQGLSASLAASKQGASPGLAAEEALSASHACVDLDRSRQAGLTASKQLGAQNLLGRQHAGVCLQLRGHCLECSRAKRDTCHAIFLVFTMHAAAKRGECSQPACGATHRQCKVETC